MFDNLDTHSGGSINNIDRSIADLDVYFYDMLDFARFVEFVSKADIINGAGSTSHQYSMREPLFDLDVNTEEYFMFLATRYNPKAYFITINNDSIW